MRTGTPLRRSEIFIASGYKSPFFHRKLRFLVVIDLKLGRFNPADAGQMHLYLNYAKEHWMHDGENPPVGVILCAQKGGAVAHYTLEGLAMPDLQYSDSASAGSPD